MCFVRGDPRTADYTVRFLVRASVFRAANDNVQPVRLWQCALPDEHAWSRSLTVAYGLGPGRAATAALATAAISGSVWLALSFFQVIAGVFG